MVKIWLSWHVYQHDRQDELLVSAIAPLLHELRHRGLFDQAFVLRYWEGGPHVRLRLAPETAAAAAALEAEVPQRLAEWCVLHPSRHPMTPAEYRLLRRHLVDAEDSDLRSDGSIVRRRYEPEVERFGTGVALRACESHFSESTAIALEVLAEMPSEPERDSLGALVVADVVRAMPATQRRQWREQMAGHIGPIRRLDPRTIGSSLAHPAAAVQQFRESLATLAHELSGADDDYVPPVIGFGGVRILGPGDSDPSATLDIAAHLFCNRIGITIPTELAIRRGIGAALAELEEAV